MKEAPATMPIRTLVLIQYLLKIARLHPFELTEAEAFITCTMDLLEDMLNTSGVVPTMEMNRAMMGGIIAFDLYELKHANYTNEMNYEKRKTNYKAKRSKATSLLDVDENHYSISIPIESSNRLFFMKSSVLRKDLQW